MANRTESIGTATFPDKPGSYNADSAYPTSSRLGFIRIRQIDQHGQPIGCEELWKCAVFELCNVRNAPAYHAIHLRAVNGQLTEKEYVKQNTAVEFKTSKETAAFFKNVWLPCVSSYHIESHGQIWFANYPDTYAEWSSAFTNPNEYPWSTWAREYRTKIMPYREAVEASARSRLKQHALKSE